MNIIAGILRFTFSFIIFFFLGLSAPVLWPIFLIFTVDNNDN